MPTKSSKSRKIKQTAKSRRNQLKQREKTQKKLDRIRVRERKAQEKETKRRLKKLEQTGLYKPKRKIKKITKARAKEINRRYRRFEEFLSGDYYLYVPIPTKSERRRKTAIKLAKKNQIATSPKGVFIPKTRNTKSAKAKFNKKTGTYRVIVKKVKTGATGKKTITEVVPIEPLVSIEQELDRVQHDAEMLKLKKGEALAYRVTLNEEGGYSYNIFQKPEQLRSYLAQGTSSAQRGTPANRLQVYRSVTVMKVKREKYFKDHPRPERKFYGGYRTDKTGRSIKRVRATPKNPRSNWMTPFEQGYAAYNSGFGLEDNPYPAPPERRQWQNGWLQAQKDDAK